MADGATKLMNVLKPLFDDWLEKRREDDKNTQEAIKALVADVEMIKLELKALHPEVNETKKKADEILNQCSRIKSLVAGNAQSIVTQSGTCSPTIIIRENKPSDDMFHQEDNIDCD